MASRHYTETDLKQILKRLALRHTARQIGREWGFSHGYVTKLILNQKAISEAVAQKLGFKRITPKPYYVRRRS